MFTDPACHTSETSADHASSHAYSSNMFCFDCGLSAGDNDFLLKEAGEIRAMLVEQSRVSSCKEKARATAAWSALMFVYLLNKAHFHLIHSGLHSQGA